MPQLRLEFLAFAAVVVGVHWALPRRWQPAWLLACGAGFLGFMDPVALALVVLGGLAVYRLAPAGAGVVVALVGLFIAVRLGQRADDLAGLPAIAAPFGFGFTMLRLVHYVVERMRGAFRPHAAVDVLHYLLFFPTLTVGPIHRFDQFQTDLGRRHWDTARFTEGLERVLYGYGKVVVLANWLVFNRNLFVPAHTLPAWAEIAFEPVQYGLYLYLSFAGYSDIAIGLSLLLGHRVMENFKSPLTQRNIGDFWQAWHLSLSDWCRRYVFLTALARWRAVAPAVLLSMVVLGLWHEFTPRFLLWGAYHGAGIVVWRWWQRAVGPHLPEPTGRTARAAERAFYVAVTLVFVTAGFSIIVGR